MTKKLSDLNNSLEFVPQSLSPMPAGTIVQAATNDLQKWTDNNWPECEGSEVSRTTYADLFANIGTKYGIGDGSTTFNLPNGPKKTLDIDLDVTGNLGTWTDQGSKGWFYQDLSGTWVFNFVIKGSSSSSGTGILITVVGLTYDITTPYRVVVSGGSVTSQQANKSLFNGTTLEIGTDAGNESQWGASGVIRLSAKPTDAVVGADSRFSTFDEALESIPVIKAYNDSSNISMSINDATDTKTGSVRLNSGFAATTTKYGFVKTPNGFLQLNTGNGQGSTNTAIRRMTNIVTDDGDAWTYADSATLGGSITFLRDCIATATYYDRSTTSDWVQCLSINSSNLSTSATDIPVTERKTLDQNSANISNTTSLTYKFSAGDVLRMHGIATDAGLTSIGRESFILVEDTNLDLT